MQLDPAIKTLETYEPVPRAPRYPGNQPVTEARGDKRPEDSAPAKPPKPLRILKPEMFIGESLPDRRWIVRDNIPCGVVTGLYGDGGIGKSLLAQQLQSAASIGGEWAGVVAEQVRSLGFYCEDDEDELKRRQARFNEHYELDAAALANVRLVSRLGEDNLMMVFDSRGRGELTAFSNQIREAARDTKSRLVVIDTAADTFGGNENDRPQVRQFVSRALGALALEIDGAVLLCAHPSRSGLATGEGDGGSTAWSNTLRSRLYLSMPEREGSAAPDADARVLSRKKANYASRNAEARLRWHNGVFVSDTPEAIAFRPCADELFLGMLSAIKTEGRRVSESQSARNFAPRVFAGRPDRYGYRAADFHAAMERLFAAGKIRVDEDGPPSKRTRFIVATGGGL